jgi:hypothetical protein
MSEERERQRRRLAIMARLREEDAQAAAASARPQTPPAFNVRELPGNVRLYTDERGQQSLTGEGVAVNDPREIERRMRPLQRAERARSRAEEHLKKWEQTSVAYGTEPSRADTRFLSALLAEQDALEAERQFSRSMGRTVQQEMGAELYASKPIATGTMQFLKSLPFAGSYFDEMAPTSPGMEQMGISGPETARLATEEMSRKQPLLSGALGLGAGVAGIAALPGALRFLTPRGGTAPERIASGLGRGAAFGAGEGAVSGYGMGTGGPTDPSRIGSAATTAGVGTLIGGVTGPMAPASVEGLTNLRQYFTRVNDRTLARELGVSLDAAAVFRGRMMNEDFDGAQEALRRAGADAMLADASPQLRAILDAVVSTSGPGAAAARAAVEERARISNQNFINYMDDVLGAPRGRERARADVREQTQEARQQAYTSAYNQPIDYSNDTGRRLEQLLRRVPPSVLRNAEEMMQLGGLERRQMIARERPDGTFNIETLPGVEEVDYIKRALNDMARSLEGQGALGGTTDRGRLYEVLARDIRNALADNVELYGNALRTAANAIEESRAIAIGYDALSERIKPDRLAMMLDDMTDAEARGAMQGLRSAIKDRMGAVYQVASDPNTDARQLAEVRKALTRENMQEKLDIIMGPNASREFLRQLDEELVSLELKAAIAANSKTNVRGELQRDIRRRIAPGILRTLGTGDVPGATKKLVQAFTGQTDEAIAIRELGIFDEIATALTGQRGRQAENALDLARRAVRGQQLSRAQAELVASAVLRPGVLTGAVAATQTYRYNPQTDDFERQ